MVNQRKMKKQVNEHPTEITYMYRGDNQIYKFKKKLKDIKITIAIL